MTIFLALAKQGRIRVILDNAALHHNTKTQKPEDQFETLFIKAAKAPAAIMRGHFGRYAHDKVLLVSKVTGKARVPRKALTGSTNFSITGLYVNSNHILVFDDPKVAATYAKVFDDAWSSKATMAFAKNGEANQSFTLTTSPEIDAHKVVLQVWPHNRRAIRLYASRGFVIEGRLVRHYRRRRTNELWDSVIMSLVLDHTSPGSPYGDGVEPGGE
jgi:phosphatidylserine/phosphatidylglycerophosphate/cardiolipin synthase-like enzyme